MNVYSDPLYGEYTLENVLVDLINSSLVQRLKRIHQGGASYLVNPKWNVTRYEHSIGVMLLIRKLGGSLEEQIAGLLHDVSHTAFSHVIDLSLGLGNEDYHDKIFSKVIFNSEIPHILQKYNYNITELLFQKWPLLDMEAPFLSVDRIDYTLRDMYTYQNISLKQCHNFIDSLIVKETYIICTSLSQCIWFVRVYKKEVIDFFYDPLNVYAYELLSTTLKIGLEKKIITYDDLLKTDDDIILLLSSSKNDDIQCLLKKLNKKVLIIHDSINFDIHQKKKIRIVDPLVLIDNEVNIASHFSPEISETNDSILNFSKVGVYLKIINY